MRTAIYAILVGAILLGLVFSTMPFLTYQDTRIVSVSITNDASGPLSLIPVQNTVGYGSGSSSNAYVYYNTSGDLTINFHDVQTNAILNLTPAFYVDDNLNQTLNVTVQLSEVSSDGFVNLLINGSSFHTFSFLLSPSEGEVPVYLTLETFGTHPNSGAIIFITFTATYPAEQQ
jgi:hypothetical protein